MTVTPAQDQAKSATAAAKAVITSLQLALKMFTLYAEDHVYCQKSIVRLHGDIETFLTKFGTLVLEIRSDCLLYEGETVHEGNSKDGDLSFALFRDGMLELVFMKGIEPEETSFLVRTIDRYKSLATTAEGDIVTALWEARLPHLYYVAADNILEIEQGKQALIPEAIEFEMPELPDQASHAQSPDEDQPAAENSLAEAAKQIDFKTITPTNLQLTAEEADHLEEMVRSEEERDATQEIMDMMGDILKDQQDEEFFAYIIEYMLEEFIAALKRVFLDAARGEVGRSFRWCAPRTAARELAAEPGINCGHRIARALAEAAQQHAAPVERISPTFAAGAQGLGCAGCSIALARWPEAC